MVISLVFRWRVAVPLSQEHGIATASLPLKKEDLRGTHSKVSGEQEVQKSALTVHAVKDIGGNATIRHRRSLGRRWVDRRLAKYDNVTAEAHS